MPVLTTHTLAGLTLAVRRFWLHHVDTESVQGSDLHMLKWCVDNDRRAHAMFHVDFGDADFEPIREAIRANAARDLQDPHSDFRRGVDWETQRYIRHHYTHVDDVLEETDDDDAFFHVGDDARQRPLVLRLHTGRGLLGIVFDHTVWDGVHVVNEILSVCIQSQPFDTKWLAKIKYTPVLDEALQIYTAYALAARRVGYQPMTTYRDDDAQRVLKHHFRTDDIKALKDRLDVPFSAAITGLYARMVHDWCVSDREVIRLGVIVACVSPRYRNNYSMIMVDTHRDDDLDTTVHKVRRQLKRRQIEVIALHNLIGSFELETLFKKHMIDVLFSPAFFDRGDGPSLSVSDMSFYNVPSSMPLYSFACSIDDMITMSSTFNSPELDVAKAREAAVTTYAYDDDRRLRER